MCDDIVFYLCHMIVHVHVTNAPPFFAEIHSMLVLNSACYLLHSWKFLPGENFLRMLSLAKFISINFCPVLMITQRIRGPSWQPLRHWRTFVPLNISAIQRYLALVKYLSSKKISAQRYLTVYYTKVGVKNPFCSSMKKRLNGIDNPVYTLPSYSILNSLLFTLTDEKLIHLQDKV